MKAFFKNYNGVQRMYASCLFFQNTESSDGKGGECFGCGPQEHFINCADVAIGTRVNPLPLNRQGQRGVYKTLKVNCKLRKSREDNNSLSSVHVAYQRHTTHSKLLYAIQSK
jgi:hypothetical protein